MKIFTFFLLIVCLLCGCAQVGYLKNPFVDIPNFYKVDDRLWRGGQPNKKGFELLKIHRIKTVISLRGEGERVEDENALVESMGMKFYNLPVSIYERPKDELILSFLEIVLNKENQPVFLHCERGRDKVGALVAVYRILVYGWTIKDAYNEAKRYGFWPYRGEGQLHKLIHQIKDKPLWFERAKELLLDAENKQDLHHFCYYVLSLCKCLLSFCAPPCN